MSVKVLLADDQPLIRAGIAMLLGAETGIEVMAGLLRRQVPDSPDAHAILADIISEAKIANAIVLEVLDFVRPIRLPAPLSSVKRYQ